MPRLLLITAAFPPATGGPADQMEKRVKYLTRLEWEIDVLTPAIGEGTPADITRTHLPEGVDVHRTEVIFQSSRPSLRHDRDRPKIGSQSRLSGLTDLLFVPGGYVRWLPSAIRLAKELARHADVILSVSNPISTHAIARAAAKAARRPWVAELRDPVVGYNYSRRGPEAFNRLIESWVVHRADGIVQWQDFVPQPVSDRYPDLPGDRFRVIAQTGFDADDFAEYRHVAPAGGPLRVCYTGSFYGDRITPIAFLQALRSCLDRVGGEQIEVTLAGDWSPQYDALVEQLCLGDCVRHLGRIPRRDCIALWQQNHVVLLILSGGGDDHDRIPSKFWDYVASGASILALVSPSGRLAGLVESERLGLAVAPTDVESIADTLATLLTAHRGGSLRPEPSTGFLAAATSEAAEAALSEFLLTRADAGSGR